MKESAYYKKMHRIGYAIIIGGMAVFFGVPLIYCLVYDIMPTFSQVMLAAGGICMVFFPLGFAELIGELPVMGTSYYLASITGNIMNIKLPAALNATKIANVKPGTEESDAVMSIAVGVSSLVTMALLAVGVLLLTPLKPFLESEIVATAATYVLPALFGCLVLGVFSKDVGGGVVIHGKEKAYIIPGIILLLLYFVIIPEQYEMIEGVIVVIMIPIIYFLSKYMYKKGKITVEMPGDTLAAEAAIGTESSDTMMTE